jgi:hypothetical protein
VAAGSLSRSRATAHPEIGFTADPVAACPPNPPQFSREHQGHDQQHAQTERHHNILAIWITVTTAAKPTKTTVTSNPDIRTLSKRPGGYGGRGLGSTLGLPARPWTGSRGKCLETPGTRRSR